MNKKKSEQCFLFILRRCLLFFMLAFVWLLPAAAGCGPKASVSTLEESSAETEAQVRASEKTENEAPTADHTEEDILPENSEPEDDQKAFQQLCDEIFREIVTSDALSMHFHVADPAALGLPSPQSGLGEISADFSSDNREKEEEWERRLRMISCTALSPEDQFTYDLLKYTLHESLKMEREDFYYYAEPLSSVSGTHTFLPILLSEYSFEDSGDVEDYLQLLSCFPSYFSDLLAFEEKKAQAGLFMSDTQADLVISSLREFARNPEENPLILTFPERLEESGLTSSGFCTRNEQLVRESVIPAYEQLAEGLEALKGQGKNENGLCWFDKGKEYYANLAKNMTGSDMTPEEMAERIDQNMNDCISKVIGISIANKSVYDEITEIGDLGFKDPEAILSQLKETLQKDFPAAPEDTCKLKYIPPSLEESMNPAFYLVPPLDRPSQHVIYLNPSHVENSGLDLFTTLAHEGYPGHLYQHAVFSQSSRHPLRSVMNYDGYQEGWAVYVEYMSYGWAGIPEDAARILALNREITMCAYARADIGIHYEGWTLEQVEDFLNDHGLKSEGAAAEMQELILSSPGSYLPYCIGALEFKEMAADAREKNENGFDIKAFHQYILEKGPCAFPVLREYMIMDGLL